MNVRFSLLNMVHRILGVTLPKLHLSYTSKFSEESQ
jgi:hypothetical protein